MLRDGLEFIMQTGVGRNREVEITEVGEGEPAEGFGSKLGDGRVKLDQNVPQLPDDDVYPGNVVETDALRDTIDTERVHKNRSRKERLADESKDAEITTDPIKWASAPDQFDYPGVDTGPGFRDTFGDDFDDF